MIKKLILTTWMMIAPFGLTGCDIASILSSIGSVLSQLGGVAQSLGITGGDDDAGDAASVADDATLSAAERSVAPERESNSAPPPPPFVVPPHPAGRGGTADIEDVDAVKKRLEQDIVDLCVKQFKNRVNLDCERVKMVREWSLRRGTAHTDQGGIVPIEKRPLTPEEVKTVVDAALRKVCVTHSSLYDAAVLENLRKTGQGVDDAKARACDCAGLGAGGLG